MGLPGDWSVRVAMTSNHKDDDNNDDIKNAKDCNYKDDLKVLQILGSDN